MGKYEDERVLVIRRDLFDELGSFEKGLRFDVENYLPRFLDPDENHFLLRDDAEDDPSHKQIIPYAIFHHAGRFLHYVRGSKSGEQRLAAKGSIGIGGHVNTDDSEASSLERDTYMTGVEREINEELNLNTSYRQQAVALLNDDTNEVGRVHLGIVHVFDLDAPLVESNEDTIKELRFLERNALRDEFERLESWSQICVDGLDEILDRVAAIVSS